MKPSHTGLVVLYPAIGCLELFRTQKKRGITNVKEMTDNKQ